MTSNKKRVNWCIDPEVIDYLKDLQKRANNGVSIGNIIEKIVTEHKRDILDRLKEKKRLLLVEMNGIDAAIKDTVEIREAGGKW